MEKEKELRPMTTELPVCASNAIQNSIKEKTLQKSKEWNCGKKRTEKRLPCYLNQGFYIPNFSDMTFETVELLNEQIR